jgi:hypothetical protein
MKNKSRTLPTIVHSGDQDFRIGADRLYLPQKAATGRLF